MSSTQKKVDSPSALPPTAHSLCDCIKNKSPQIRRLIWYGTYSQSLAMGPKLLLMLAVDSPVCSWLIWCSFHSRTLRAHRSNRLGTRNRSSLNSNFRTRLKVDTYRCRPSVLQPSPRRPSRIRRLLSFSPRKEHIRMSCFSS